MSRLRARRALLLAPALLPLAAAGATVVFPPVVPRALAFPRDHGAHPDYRVEWWYLTGLLDDVATGSAIGLQVTFFRLRTAIDPANPSRFAAQQLLFAHAALAEPARGSLLVDQRIARVAAGAARISPADTDLGLQRWTFARRGDGRYECHLPARGFTLRFTATPSQPLLLQGQAGYFPKQDDAGYGSYYYSAPQLRIEAEIMRDGRKQTARGVAWLDHEWLSTLLEAEAAGWDWLGMNLDDGTALVVYQTRRKAGGAPLYTYAALRAPGETQPRIFGRKDIRMEPLEHWESPRTRARYPVAQRITVGARSFETRPLFADQELDARLTGSAIYWEGASQLTENGRRAGRGYLELTGYAAPLTL